MITNFTLEPSLPSLARNTSEISVATLYLLMDTKKEFSHGQTDSFCEILKLNGTNKNPGLKEGVCRGRSQSGSDGGTASLLWGCAVRTGSVSPPSQTCRKTTLEKPLGTALAGCPL